ncbi:MAG: hypothetical protein WC992_05730 [Acholeplasmataceae bacterium]
MPQLPSLLILQWGLIGFYVVIYFILGFLRGGSKSTYFTLVAFITTFLSLFAISFISLNLILSDSFTLVSLLEMIDSRFGNIIPAEVYTYLSDPELAGFAVALVDLILRIVGFIILYPFIKFLLTLIIFRPIWSFGIKKALLKKQNEKLEVVAMEQNKKKFVPTKKLKKTLLGRFVGGFMGSLQGVLVAFIVLMPILIISGFLTVAPSGEPVDNQEEGIPLAVGMPDLGPMADMLDDYLLQIDEMNQQGLGAMVKQITVSGKPIDRYIFDRIFTTQVKKGEDSTDINWINELEGILNITRTIYDGGYLESGFTLDEINEEKLDDVEVVFNYLGSSDLIAYMIPAAAAFGLENFRDQLPAQVSDELAEAAVGQIQEIDWKAEFGNIKGIVDAVLSFGSVQEIQAYMSDPNALLDLSPEEGEKLADIIRAIGEMQILELVSVGAEYATTLAEVQNQLTWIAEEERQAYLEEKLSFLIDDAAFFSGEEGEFERFALLVEAIYTDEYGDVNLRQLISTADAEAFMAAQNTEWIDGLLEHIVELELLLNAIPVGVDYALYSQMGDLVDAELAAEIETALADISWEDEILNVGDIYKEAVSIGAASLLGENPNMLLFVDNAMENHMDSIRVIVEKIFEESALVNAALDLAAPIMVERFVTNQELAAIVQEALISDPESGVVDFNVGQEINTVLDIVETVYEFTTLSEVANFSGMTTESKFELFAGYGSLTEAQFESFKTAFESLQILQRVSGSGLTYVKNSMGVEQIYIPDEVNLGEDIGSILGLGYYVAKYTYDNKPLYPTYEEIDFAPLFADDTFRSYLLPSELNNHSELILSTIAHNAMVYADNESFSQYLVVPESLKLASPESSIWHDEINALLGAIFDVAASFEDSTVLTFSYRDIMTFKNAPTAASIELITQFADPVKADDTFGSLDSSVILRSSIKQIIDNFGGRTVDALGGYEIKVPAIALDGDMLKEDIIVELINGLAVMIDDMNQTWEYETISQLTSNLSVNAILPAYNNVTDDALITFGEVTLIKGVISEMILSDAIKNFGVEKLNGAQTFFVAPDDFLDLDPLLLDSEGLKGEEIGKLLISIKSLQLNSTGDLSSFGPQMLNQMIDRNIDLVDGQDDLDRFFDSGILYTLIDKAIQLDGLNDFVNDTLSGAFDDAEITIDLTPHPDILGNAIDHEPIEVGRITKQEFRNIVVSTSLIGPFGEVGIETFAGMADPYAEEDDFTTFLESDYIYTILGRMFENEGFGDFIGGFLGNAFGEGIDLDMTTPSDAKGTVGVEEDIMTKNELRRLMISFKLIGLDQGTDINESNILALSGANDIEGTDDFDRFIQSKYLADKLSIILTSDTIIEMLAMGRFLPADFILPTSSYTTIDGRERLTNTEFAAIFNGLEVLEVEGFDGGDLGPDSLTGRTSEEIDEVLESDYLYTVIDLMLKSETSFTIPDGAFELGGTYDGMVNKNEISDIFIAMSTLGVTGGEPPAAEDITIADLQELLANTDSFIVRSMLSEPIISSVGEENIPEDAYESPGVLTQEELVALVDALEDISGNSSTPVSEVGGMLDELTVGQINELDLGASGSLTIKQIVSDTILEQLGLTEIPEDAYEPLAAQDNVVLLGMTLADEEDPLRRLSDTELGHIIDALNILADNNPNLLVTEIPTDPTVGKARALKTTQSLIIRLFITIKIEEQLVTELPVFPVAAYDETYDTLLSVGELDQMIEALAVLADKKLPEPYDVNDELVSEITPNVTVGQAVDLIPNTSIIINQLVSDKIIVGLVLNNRTIPDSAYVDEVEKDVLKDSEIDEMILALDILAGGNQSMLVSAVPTDVTIGQLKGLTVSESIIIQRLITDSVLDATELNYVPDQVYLGGTPGDQLDPQELEDLILALEVLAGSEVPGDRDHVDILDVPTDPTVGQAKVLKLNDSLIINQLISESIVDVLTLQTVEIPDDAYTDEITQVTLKDSEIDAMLTALETLSNGDDTVKVSQIDTDITIGQLDELTSSSSLIMIRLINDSVIDAVGESNIPDDAYVGDVSGDTLKPTEIEAMVDALRVIADDPDDLEDDPDEVRVSQLEGFDITVGQAVSLKPNGSVIIKQMISDGIVDILTPAKIRDTAYIGGNPNNRLTNDEIGYMIDALSDLAVAGGGDESTNVNEVPVNENTLSIDVLQGFNENSIILNRLISNAIIDGLGADNIPFESYEDSLLKTDLIRPEIDAVLEALSILEFDSNNAGNIGMNDLTFVDLDDVVAIGTTDPVNYPDGFSPIVVHLLSDAMIQAVSDIRSGHEYGVPSTAYRNDLDLLHDEIEGLVAALKIIGDIGPEDEEQTIASVTITPTSFGPDMLAELIALDNLIVYRLISKGINEADIDTDPSHVTDVLARNYDPELPVAPEIYDIKISEMEHIAESMDVLGITTIATIKTDITIPKLQTLTGPQLELIIEATVVPETNANTIIYYIISETVDPGLNLFDLLVAMDPITYPGPANDYYVMDGEDRVRLKRTSIADAIHY